MQNVCLGTYLNQSAMMTSVTIAIVRPNAVSISFSRQYRQMLASVIGCLTVPTGHQDESERDNGKTDYQLDSVVPDVLKPNLCHWMSFETHLMLNWSQSIPADRLRIVSSKSKSIISSSGSVGHMRRLFNFVVKFIQPSGGGIRLVAAPPQSEAHQRKKTTMMMKFALCGIALAAIATPALAADEFFVVQDSATKGCSIVAQKPTLATIKVVGMAYDTKVKAEAAMKAEKLCETK
jgi:hypothetical protein